MNVYCPQCGTELEVGVDIEGCASCPTCTESLDISALRVATCPICGCGFEESDEIRICPDCKVPHHDECWTENRGCSTYGCASAAHQETHTTENTCDGSDVNAGMVPCPACGAMHPASDLVCGVCGKLLGNDLPGDSAGVRLKETVSWLGSEAKANLWPRLARNFQLLGRDVAAVFRLWWGEFSRYVQFSGMTTRREYIAFGVVNMAVNWLFFVCDATPLVVLALLSVFLPTLASTVRRLRDTDISPWLIFAFPVLPFLMLVPSVTSDELPPNTDELAPNTKENE